VAYPRGGGTDRFSLTATYYGPAYMITEMDGVLPSKMLVAHTPIDEGSLHLRFGVILPRVADDDKMAGFVKAYADNLLIGFREDIQIWENKCYRVRPRLVAEDGPLGRMRQWYRQFYTPRAEA
jgi:3-ketosteroid 9alpha-monooxygenase subunit A